MNYQKIYNITFNLKEQRRKKIYRFMVIRWKEVQEDGRKKDKIDGSGKEKRWRKKREEDKD